MILLLAPRALAAVPALLRHPLAHHKLLPYLRRTVHYVVAPIILNG